MSQDSLTQSEANALIRMKKRQSDKETRDFPTNGQKLLAPLVSERGGEKFILDVYSGRASVSVVKESYQLRGRRIVPLARLDYDQVPHCNPDGEEISGPHLHVYRAGDGQKWARPLSEMPEHFPDLQDSQDLEQLFLSFLRYCNIAKILVRRVKK